MTKTRRMLFMSLALFALLVVPAGAEVFSVRMTNDTVFTTRYQPQQDGRDESKLIMLTEFGNFISLPKASVAEITSETESRGFGTVLDTSTIMIGWAPNDKPGAEEVATDPTSRLLNYLENRDSAPEQDFSVQQFVTTEGAGQGGLPASGVTSSGSSSFPVGGAGPVAAEPSTIDQ